MRAALAMHESALPLAFPPSTRRRLDELLDVSPGTPVGAAELAGGAFRDLEVLVTGWGAPALTPAVLDALPALRAIVHWGGAVDFVDPEGWRRGILVSSAGSANAIPVAEFTVAMITLAAKDAFWVADTYRREQRFIDRDVELSHVGAFGTTVGIVGASRIGSLVLESLRRFDLTSLLYDPTCSPERARQLGAELVGDLVELAARSRILSIHAPVLPPTVGMISREVLAALSDGSTLINTARGVLVDQDALVSELRSGRLRAILDVTEPEVLPAGHPLYDLPNVFLTPHLAGSAGTELERLGLAALAEIERLVAGEPLQHLVAAPS